MAYLGLIPDLSTSGSINTLSGTLQQAFTGHNSAAAVITGTWQGTMVFDVSCDGGVTWSQVWFTQISNDPVFSGTPIPIYSITSTGSANINGTFRIFNTTGVTHVRARMSAYTSGTANVVLTVVAAVPNFMFTHGSILQSVVADANNSSETNLAVGNSYTFTGTATSTLGVAGLQVSLKTDQNCRVFVDQSPNGTDWDISDAYNYSAADNNFGVTVQAINSYYRVRVISPALTTTYFRLQAALCPIVEALPRSLDVNGRLKLGVMKDDYGFEMENTPTGEIRTATISRLVGAAFEGTTLDTNFWTSTVANAATVTQSSASVLLTSGVDAAGSAKLNSVRRARYTSAAANRFRGVIQLDGGQTNNTRKWGVGFGVTMPTITDGAYFKLSGTTLSVETLKAGVATTVSSGSFNGNLGLTYSVGTTVLTYEIYWTNSAVWFSIGGSLLHKVSASSATWADTMHHYIYMDNINSGNTTSVILYCRVASIVRLGNLLTQPMSRHFTTAQGGTILKYGPGNVHRLICCGNNNNAKIQLYDGTDATGTLLLSFTFSSSTINSYDLGGLPFFTGLFLNRAAQNSAVTVVYE